MFAEIGTRWCEDVCVKSENKSPAYMGFRVQSESSESSGGGDPESKSDREGDPELSSDLSPPS